MILLIGGEKGGTGKTTIATNLAVLRAQAGRDVLLLDTDKQGSANLWASLREENGHQPRIATLQKTGKSIQNDILALTEKYQDILIDTGGRDSFELRAAMTVADRMYIPIQASQFDIATTGTMDELAAQVSALNPKLISFFLINRASPNPRVAEYEEALSLFEELENIGTSGVVVCDRIAYRRAARGGLAVHELPEPDTKAVQEMQKLYAEIFQNS